MDEAMGKGDPTAFLTNRTLLSTDRTINLTQQK